MGRVYRNRPNKDQPFIRQRCPPLPETSPGNHGRDAFEIRLCSRRPKEKGNGLSTGSGPISSCRPTPATFYRWRTGSAHPHLHGLAPGRLLSDQQKEFYRTCLVHRFLVRLEHLFKGQGIKGKDKANITTAASFSQQGGKDGRNAGKGKYRGRNTESR